MQRDGILIKVDKNQGSVRDHRAGRIKQKTGQAKRDLPHLRNVGTDVCERRASSHRIARTCTATAGAVSALSFVTILIGSRLKKKVPVISLPSFHGSGAVSSLHAPVRQHGKGSREDGN